MSITEALAGAAASPQVQAAAIEKVSSATGFLATRDTPKRLAVKSFIDDVRASNLDPTEKAAVIWNAKRTVKEYANQKDIVDKAIAKLTNQAKPQDVEDSWLETFLDEARVISDDDLRTVWSHLLAEELETPGTVPRQVIQIVKYMDKPDAEAFSALCNFSVAIVGNDESHSLTPIILGSQVESYYAHNGLTRNDLVSLESRGLIAMPLDYVDDGGYILKMGCPSCAVYGPESFDFPNDYLEVRTGLVSFTKAGIALASAFDHRCIPNFFKDKCVPFWKRSIASGNDILGLRLNQKIG